MPVLTRRRATRILVLDGLAAHLGIHQLPPNVECELIFLPRTLIIAKTRISATPNDPHNAGVNRLSGHR